MFLWQCNSCKNVVNFSFVSNQLHVPRAYAELLSRYCTQMSFFLSSYYACGYHFNLMATTLRISSFRGKRTLYLIFDKGILLMGFYSSKALWCYFPFEDKEELLTSSPKSNNAGLSLFPFLYLQSSSSLLSSCLPCNAL